MSPDQLASSENFQMRVQSFEKVIGSALIRL